jgi:hypothetical protein
MASMEDNSMGERMDELRTIFCAAAADAFVIGGLQMNVRGARRMLISSSKIK